ncbi:MAG: LemA family protein [Acidimicrobiales bacterium]
MVVIIVIVAAAAVVVVGGFLAYNGLVRRRVRTREAWAEIDVELQRRHDLIPNLVETVKGYAAHERATFDAVTSARADAIRAGATGSPATIGAAEDALSSSLRSLFAVAEAYPQLRAVDSFIQLQEELTATESRIQFARRYFNTSVRDYNAAVQTFPRNLLASVLGFKAVEFLQIEEPARALPQVSFDTGPDPSAPIGSPGARPGSDRK